MLARLFGKTYFFGKPYYWHSENGRLSLRKVG